VFSDIGAHAWTVFWQSATRAELGPGQRFITGWSLLPEGCSLSEMLGALPADSRGGAVVPIVLRLSVNHRKGVQGDCQNGGQNLKRRKVEGDVVP
jgi:hypothetical protein